MIGLPSLETAKIALLLALIGGLVIGTADITHKVDASRYTALQEQIVQAHADALQAALDEQKRQDQISTEAAQREAAAQSALAANTKRQLSEIQKHVKSMAGCPPLGLVRLLDAGAFGVSADSLPLPTGQFDLSCATVDWPTLARSVVDNYGTARANAEQLDALSGFYRSAKR